MDTETKSTFTASATPTVDDATSACGSTSASAMTDSPLQPSKTVLRLKRRLDDSPSPTKVLVMSYKRRKVNSEAEALEEVSKIFHLAGTVNESDVSTSQTIKNALDNAHNSKTRKGLVNAESKQLKTREVRLHQKAKEDVRAKTQNNRFRVVSRNRGLQDFQHSTDAEENMLSVPDTELFSLFDLISEDDEVCDVKKRRQHIDPRESGSVTMNGIPMTKESASSSSSFVVSQLIDESKFVFDLYVASDGTILEDQILNNVVSVHGCDEDFQSDFDNGDDSDSEKFFAEDDEDSNDEGNWRNDYPDSDPDHNGDNSYGGENEDYDIVGQFSSVRLHGNELSSDDEEDCIYSTENDGADDGLGGMYNRYKSRILRNNELTDEVVSSPSESDID